MRRQAAVSHVERGDREGMWVTGVSVGKLRWWAEGRRRQPVRSQ